MAAACTRPFWPNRCYQLADPKFLYMERDGIPRIRAAWDLLPAHCSTVARTSRLVASSALVPMGMETMVYFVVESIEVCGRVNPNAAGNAGEIMPLVADLNHMHLIDPRTDAIL